MRQRLLDQRVHRDVIEHVALLVEDAVLAMGREGIQGHVAHHSQLGKARTQGADGALGDAFGAVLLEQLGPEAVDRLRQLAQSQQGFDRQLAGYLAELEPLLPLERAEQQQAILARWFEPGQWRRVEALTRQRLGERP